MESLMKSSTKELNYFVCFAVINFFGADFDFFVFFFPLAFSLNSESALSDRSLMESLFPLAYYFTC